MIFNMVLFLLAIGMLGLCGVLINIIIKPHKKTISFGSIISFIIFSVVILAGVLIGVDDLLNTNITENILVKISPPTSDSLIKEPSLNNNSNIENETISLQNKKDLLKNIVVDIDFQDIIDDKKKIVVNIKNNSTSEIFNGVVNLDTKNVSKKYSGGDTIYIENLPPNQSTFAIVWVKSNAISSSYSIKGDFTKAPSTNNNLSYEIASNIGGNGNVELFIVVNDLSVDNLKLISHELKQKYTKNIVTVLDAHFYSTADREYAVNSTFPEYELNTFSLNYKTNESELVIPHIDNTLNELLFERIPIQ